MKNIQIIDGADNATYSIFQATDDEFVQLFPGVGQDLEVADDVFARLGDQGARRVLEPIWNRPIYKPDVAGIHGTIFYNYADKRMHLPKSKCEVDRDPLQINQAERELYASVRTQNKNPGSPPSRG